MPTLFDHPLLPPASGVGLERAPEGVGFCSFHPIQDMPLALFAQIREVPRLEDVELGHGVVLIPGETTEGFGIQGLEPDGIPFPTDHSHGLPDGLSNGSGKGPPDRQFDPLGFGHSLQLQAHMGGALSHPNRCIQTSFIAERERAVGRVEDCELRPQITARDPELEQRGGHPFRHVLHAPRRISKPRYISALEKPDRQGSRPHLQEDLRIPTAHQKDGRGGQGHHDHPPFRSTHRSSFYSAPSQQKVQSFSFGSPMASTRSSNRWYWSDVSPNRSRTASTMAQ